MEDATSINRRSFLKKSIYAAAAAGVAPTVLPARGQAVLGANDRINIGIIGLGGIGMDHIRQHKELIADGKANIKIAAVCDIYEPRKQRGQAATGADLHHDYRELLDRNDIHAVIIGTPDHWHAKMSIDAMEAGKDVHVEKPMTRYLDEAKQMVQVAHRTKRIVQVGAEGTSKDVYWQAQKLIRDGALGKVVWVTGGVYRNDPRGDWNWPIEPECTPKTLDWNAFLGPAPKRPFDSERYFRFRKYWDYSGGLAHDLIAHVLAALQTCMGYEFPKRVCAAGGIYIHHDRETPDTFHMMVEYPSNYVATLFCTQTTTTGVDMAIRGEQATLTFESAAGQWYSPDTVVVTPQPPFKDELEEKRVPRQPRLNHNLNFFESIRTRKPPHYPVDAGYRTMASLCLGVRSWREGKMFTFDPETETVQE